MTVSDTEWQAQSGMREAIAPNLNIVNSADDLAGYVVIAVSALDDVELVTNLADDLLRWLLEHVMPDA